MKVPANAVPDSIVMTFVYEKQGQKVEFTADKFQLTLMIRFINSKIATINVPGKERIMSHRSKDFL
jgi:hypothetical protein